MSIGSFFVARAAKLPRRRNRARRERNLGIAMRDGIHLAAELHRPRKDGRYPTLLMRVPYGLRAFSAVATAYAERGYNVVLQACRGTDRSEGEFDPLIRERDDGLDTLAWIKAQPWFDGRLGTTGASYLGYAQWAIADSLPTQSAMAVKISSAEFRSVVFPGGSFHLGLWLGWMQIVQLLRSPPFGIARKLASGYVEKRTLDASMQLPLIDADIRATGHEVPFWHRWLEGAIGNDTFWAPLDHTHRIGPRTPPTAFVSGWYDFMVDQLLRDYQTLRGAGVSAQLTVGPWWHVSPELQLEGFRETLLWMDAKLRDDPFGLPEKTVRLFVTGEEQWRRFDDWPPPVDGAIWHMRADRTLGPNPPTASAPSTFRYDPSDPTPSVGGAVFAFSGVGPVDQAPLESRRDVLVFTSEPLAQALTVIGNVRASIYARASLPHADIFVRLSDVDGHGKSINICDGIVRQSAADPTGIWRLEIGLHATAHRFNAGHRLRVVIAGGAHPRYARNTGTDEPFGSATTLRAADIEILHDPEHPSAIHLPVFKG